MFSCAKAKCFGISLRVLRVGSGPTITSRGMPWALKGKLRLLGLRPPGGNVHSATSLGSQKVQASSSTLFYSDWKCWLGPFARLCLNFI